MMFAYERYDEVLAEMASMQDMVPRTSVPGPGPDGKYLVPWIVEAPLNAVEILEAILQPSDPFPIFTAHHIHRGCTTGRNRYTPASCQRLYSEYKRLQGCLEKDRDISFICIPWDAVRTIRSRLWGIFTPVRLQYISIPWFDGAKQRFENPWALVLHARPEPGTIHTYENRFRVLLERLGLSGCRFPRSLLKPGTTPLPECLCDWFEGLAGTTAASQYYSRLKDGCDENKYYSHLEDGCEENKYYSQLEDGCDESKSSREDGSEEEGRPDQEGGLEESKGGT